MEIVALLLALVASLLFGCGDFAIFRRRRRKHQGAQDAQAAQHGQDDRPAHAEVRVFNGAYLVNLCKGMLAAHEQVCDRKDQCDARQSMLAWLCVALGATPEEIANEIAPRARGLQDKTNVPPSPFSRN